MALADPALILVVRLASDRIFRTFVPLATSRLLLFVTEHSLENQLVIHRNLNRVALVQHLKLCISIHLFSHACDNIGSYSSLFEGISDDLADSREPLNVLILAALYTSVQILKVFRCESRIARQMQAEQGASSAQTVAHLEDDAFTEARSRQVHVKYRLTVLNNFTQHEIDFTNVFFICGAFLFASLHDVVP